MAVDIDGDRLRRSHRHRQHDERALKSRNVSSTSQGEGVVIVIDDVELSIS